LTADPLSDGIARLRTMRAASRVWPNVRRDLDAGLREVAQGRRGVDLLDELVGLLERADGVFEAAALGMYPPGEEEFREMTVAVAEATRRCALALTFCAGAAAAARDHDPHEERVVEPLRRAAALIGAIGADVWTAWLAGSPRAPSTSNALIVASCNPVGGIAGRMTVQRIEEPELVMHPTLALRPLGAQLMASVRAAWAGTLARHGALGHGVVWNLEFDDARGFQGDGDSLGLAAAIAFDTTVQGLRCDADVLVAGALCPSCQGLHHECCGPDLALAEVGGLTDKVDAAKALATPARRIVTPGYGTAGDPPVINGLPVAYSATLAEAIDELSGLRRDLGELHVTIRGAPDRSPAPYLGERRLSEVFIWQDLLFDEPDDDAGQAQGGEAPPDAGRISEANREAGEGPPVAPEGPRRRTWREVEARLLAAGADQMLLLQGAAGSGKSSHLAMVAAAIAERADRGLQDATTPDEVPLVVPVALEQLTRIAPTLRPETEALLDAQVLLKDDRLFEFRRRLVHQLEGRGATARAATYLAARVHEERCWLVLDALDQADLEQLDRLLPAADADAADRLRCRVIVSSRPGGPIPRAFAAAPRARIADLTDPQVEHYVRARFADENRRERVMAMLESPAVADLCRNPFLLTLTSWVADRDQLPGDVTRNILLEFVLLKLLAWDPRTSTEDADRADAWFRTLPRIAFALLRSDPTRQSVRRAALARAIEANGHYPAPQQPLPDRARRIDEAEDLVTELVRRGVLVDDEPDEENHTMLRWPHRLFAEFLAAEGMAQILCGENEPT
jgi:hypothetical protein